MNRRLQVSIVVSLIFALLLCAGWSTVEETIAPPVEYVAETDIIQIVTPVIPKEVLNSKPEKIQVEKMVETTSKPEPMEIPVVEEVEPEPEPEPKPEPEPEPKPEPEPEPKPEISMSKEDMELIAHMTMAEAEGESEYGQRLVIDTILNRVDSSTFPDSVYGVLYQPYQFSSIKDGRFARCHVKKELYELVVEEVQNRTNYDVIFFRTGHYSEYGTPLFKEGAHYFNSL